MLGVLVWIVVILLICFSVTGWHWIIFYVVILPFSTLLFFFYVDFPENRFNIKRFKNDIKYLLNLSSTYKCNFLGADNKQ